MWLCTLQIGIHFLKDYGFPALVDLRDPFDDLCCVQYHTIVFFGETLHERV